MSTVETQRPKILIWKQRSEVCWERKTMDPELRSDGLADGRRKVTVTATCLAAKLQINDALYWNVSFHAGPL